jgi:hypothetical protein
MEVDMKTALLAASIFLLTALSAFFDAKGFVYASQSWKAGSMIPGTALLSLVNFTGGVALYIVSIGFQQRLGVNSAALQSIFWFAMTVVGIALLDGSIAQWSVAERVVGAGVSVGIGWLLISTSH